MKNRMKYLLVLFFFVIVINSITITSSRYVTSKNETITLSVREPMYSIIYNANGGTGTMNKKTFTYNESGALDENKFTKYGYEFIGWNTDINGNGTSYSDKEEIFNLTSIDGSEINLYAQYEALNNIRISNVTLSGSQNASSSNLVHDYENIQSHINLNNSSSYVTYKVDITNYLNKNMGVLSIDGLPSNLEYEIVNDYDLKTKLCNANNSSGTRGEILLKIKYKNDGYVSGNTNYDINLNFVFKEVYNITYSGIYSANNYPSGVILNNFPVDINSIEYPSEIMEGDTLEINFYPHVPTTLDVSDTVTSSYQKSLLTLSNPHGDVLVENLTRGEFIVYDHPDSYTFTGNNYIDTQIMLLSQQNSDKDFSVTFYVDSYDNNQNSLATLFNSMDESGSPWPGIMTRTENNEYIIEANGGAENGVHTTYSMTTTKKIELCRIRGIIYLRINDGSFVRYSDYTNYNRFFNVSATFGASKDGNSNPWRYFKGRLSQMEIRFLDTEVRKSYYIPENVLFEHIEAYTFNNDNLNTNIRLFNQENFDKDFEITLNVDSLGSGNGNDKNTILNSMYEAGVNQSGKSDYPGFAFRIENNQYVITANMDSAFITYDINQSNPNDNLRTIKFTREDRKLYYQINDKPRQLVYDFNDGKTVYFDTPVTFGSSLNDSNQLIRSFSGTLSNMTLKLMD